MSEKFPAFPEARHEASGSELIENLRAAAEKKDEARIVAALSEIQKKINAAYGADSFLKKPYYDENERRYRFSLSSGTSGTRIFFSPEDVNANLFPGKLIFPNVNMDHEENGKTLAQAFVEVFGAAAKDVNSNPKQPYYVVDVLEVAKK